jgi:hypothetical protein
MTRLALLQDGFDLADLYAVEGWHATGAVALDAELASVQPVATGVGDDPLASTRMNDDPASPPWGTGCSGLAMDRLGGL